MIVLNFEIPVPSALKRTKKTRLIEEIISSFEAGGISDVGIVDSYYLDLRSDIEPLAFVIVIQVIANIVTIALGIREFLRKPEAEGIREFRLKTDSKSVVIKGEMSLEDIIKILKKVKAVE